MGAVRPDASSVVSTEYWYLCWWDPWRQAYARVYRETTRHTYVLRPTAGTWKVFECVRPWMRPQRRSPGTRDAVSS